MEKLRFIEKISWEEIFQAWKNREANNLGWINCATKIKGWPDWESWRRFSASLINAENRAWSLYEITEPNLFLPNMIIGPFSGWQKFLPEKNKLSFREALEIPEFFEQFSHHAKVLDFVNNFHGDSQFIGVVLADNNKIVCLEGHHRAVAIALAEKLSRPIKFDGKITIALADLNLGEEKLLDNILARGSSK